MRNPPFIAVVDILATYQADLAIKGAQFYGTTSLVTDSYTNGRIDASSFLNNDPPSIGNPLFYVGHQQTSLMTVNTGMGTIAADATSTTITHGLWATPGASDIQVT